MLQPKPHKTLLQAFNSPRGIRCVWTTDSPSLRRRMDVLSTPRGELGVFGQRLMSSLLPVMNSFNSPRGIRCVWTCQEDHGRAGAWGLSTPRGELGVFGRHGMKMCRRRSISTFNSPRGIRCVWTFVYIHFGSGTGTFFQLPEGN